MKKIYLFGGGGHALSCIDAIESEKKFKILGIIDKNLKLNKKISNYPIVKKFKKNVYGLVSVGQIKTPKTRIKIFNEIKHQGLKPAVIVSAFSTISKNVKIGEGTIVMHGAIINSKARIGKNCIINTGCIIEHEVLIEDHCHIAPGTILNGGVVVKSGSFVGSGSVIRQNLIIKKNSVLPMGSVIKK
tara:strand:- start:434 stop:994 length:561 start_codon:yes stop_codon:yes gene_type:complete